MSVADVQKLRSKKWERLKGTKLSTFEIDIIWRLWNNCLITFKIANKMGLMSTGNCAFCGLVNPNCQHLAHCTSTKQLWEVVWALLEKMKFTFRKREPMFGYDSSPLPNTVIFLALVTLYRRFLYSVNSGKSDYDLIKSYKQLVFEKIYTEFIIAKSNNQLATFTVSWGDGTGIFSQSSGKIDIRL
jgi:hypothetical protein